MIKSMTGYGRGEASVGPLRVTVEVRGVNHRFADIKVKLPADLASLEQELARRVARKVRRGRVDVTISVSRGSDAPPALEINRPVVEAYLKASERLRADYGLTGEVTVQQVLALPDAMLPRVASGSVSETESAAVTEALDGALTGLEAMRSLEGRTLAGDLDRRAAAIERLRERMAKRSPRMAPLYAKRLKARIRELNGARVAEPSRLAQEVALLADRSDITEELVRLGGHVEQLRGMLSARGGEPVGKKLDFIMQEMNREANTINSKAIDLAICRDALEVKVEVERIREQVQNIE